MNIQNNSSCFDLRFEHPATHYVTGPSGCGKTARTNEILRTKNILIKNGDKIKNVVYCYAVWQPIYQKLKDDEIVDKWVNEMPTEQMFINFIERHCTKGGSIVVIDDFMSKMNEDLVKIVTVTARHHNTSVFLLVQSLFPPNKFARQISLNMKYMHIHKNPREAAQVGTLARQIYRKDAKWVEEVYKKATEKEYSALLWDLTQQCNDKLRLRSNYLFSEKPMFVYNKK